MESNLYNKVLEVNKNIYSVYANEYLERTKNGHKNYLGEFINKFVTCLQGTVVYDLGCGPGRDLLYFADRGLKAIGIDCSQGMIELCQEQNLVVQKNDFLSMQYEDKTVDGFWAYTSHTVIPKDIFEQLIRKYKSALKSDVGVLALGMIEGDFEGWKQDSKYDGTKRYVSRYSAHELEGILRKYFGSVSVERVKVDDKVYLHCLCKNTLVASAEDTVNAAKNIFNKFSDQYLENTQTGIKLLEKDRAFFADIIKKDSGSSNVLDIGCGPGRDLLQLRNKGVTVLGIDISEANVENCLKHGVDAIQGDIYKLEVYFEENEFDGVWCNCSVTNWIVKEKLGDVLRMIKRIVKKDGCIFVGSVLGNFTGWEIDEKYDHLERYNNHWNETELREYLDILGEVIYERKLVNTGKKDYLNMVYKNEK